MDCCGQHLLSAETYRNSNAHARVNFGAIWEKRFGNRLLTDWERCEPSNDGVTEAWISLQVYHATINPDKPRVFVGTSQQKDKSTFLLTHHPCLHALSCAGFRGRKERKKKTKKGRIYK